MLWIMSELLIELSHPGDEGRNFCLLCLIDVSLIAIRVFGGGGVQLETD